MKVGVPSGVFRPIDSIERQRELVETLTGQRGDPLDRAVTYRDLVDEGFAIFSGSGILSGGGGNIKPAPQPPGGLPAPPVPVNLQANGGFAAILLDWQYEGYNGHSHTEVWRASTNNLGNALLVGTTAAKVYTDYVTQTGATYYYWVRNVSITGDVSAYNSTNGTPAYISTDPTILVTLLQGQVSNSMLNAALGSRITNIESTNTSIQTQITDLYTTFGNSQSSADNLAAAQAAAAAATAAKVDAIGAKDAAIQAKVDAIAAKDGSIVAKDSAVAAQTAANTSANNAASSATTASTHAATSATNAATASTASTAATAAKVAAESANTQAQTASGAAATSATNAATYATNSQTAATASETAKVAAQSAKTDAQTAATAAATSSTTASTAATNAASASTAATNAKIAAEAAKTDAQTSATAAATSATTALGYSDSAGAASAASTQAKLDSQAARDNAAASATAASTSATSAATSATNASSSASAANTSKIAAETANTNANTAKDAAVTAKNAAEVAKTDAVSAKNDAQTAQAAAAVSQTAAANSATAAGNSANAAAGSASTASTKATESSNSATAANTAKVAAQSARDAAQTSADAAAGSATTATTKANDAQASANSASTSATTATAAKDAAEGFKNTAQSQATAATTAKDAASASATAASNSATAASNSATSASSSAANALTYRNQAATSESNAAGYAAASAQDFSTINARLNNFGGSGVTVEQNATATANNVTGLSGQYTVKIDNNGYVSGFGLASTAAVSGTPTSEFRIRADRFSIGSPIGATNEVINPFIVQTTTTYIDGVEIKPGVYIDKAVIKYADITGAIIKNGTIDNAKITIGLDAAKITTGKLEASRIELNTSVLESVYSPVVGRNVLQIAGGAITNDLIAANANISGAKIGSLNVEKLTGDVAKFVSGYAAPSGSIPSTFQTYITMNLPKSTHSQGHKPFIQVGIIDQNPYPVGGYVQIWATPIGDGTATPALGPIAPSAQSYWTQNLEGFTEFLGWILTFTGYVDISIGDVITSNNNESGTVTNAIFTGSQTTISVEIYNGTLGSSYTRTRPTIPNGQEGTPQMLLDSYWDAYDMTSVAVFCSIPQTTLSWKFEVKVRAQWNNALFIARIDSIAMGLR